MADTILGVLASGRGSNLQAIIDAIQAGKIKAKIGVVISDKPDAKALERASEYGIPAICINRKTFGSKAAFEEAIADELNKHEVELVILAGFMRILGSDFISMFSGRIMNIHPALLPAFTGLHAQQQAIDYGVRVSGCTVHFVDEGTDTGPIILQQAVPVMPDDTADKLAERILKVEHLLYPEAVALYCEGRLRLDGRKVIIIDEEER
ncbi:MAG: phosphoribosylglycinamide formyltransferase [Negativicutes bacterium]|jgi:phosphoribosylglycinamide formyltransferase-1